jgi:peptide/nickel transport system permease protein
MLLILLFSVKLGWLPLNGYQTNAHYVLPIAAIVLNDAANTIRMTKAEVLEVYQEKFVLTAYAKGLKNRAVVIRHVLRNSLILVVVTSFMSIPWIICGSIIIENIFVIPGLGTLLTESIINQDFPVVQAIVLLVTALTIVCNILSDIITALLDPRIRIEIAGGGAK